MLPIEDVSVGALVRSVNAEGLNPDAEVGE
jgi:hypothetical protein